LGRSRDLRKVFIKSLVWIEYLRKFQISWWDFSQNLGGTNYGSKFCVRRRNFAIEGNLGFSHTQNFFFFSVSIRFLFFLICLTPHPSGQWPRQSINTWSASYLGRCRGVTDNVDQDADGGGLAPEDFWSDFEEDLVVPIGWFEILH
jgi:hypothetical protein